jgi:hypothetical protein
MYIPQKYDVIKHAVDGNALGAITDVDMNDHTVRTTSGWWYGFNDIVPAIPCGSASQEF